MASEQSQVEVQATFSNETFARLELMKIETYSGFFQDGGPEAVLEKGAKTSFKHSGTPSGGSKVGVAYRGLNENQWVLAWYVPEPSISAPPAPLKPNKVLGKHVKAGESIDWEKIEKELDDATSEVNTPYFKALITPQGNKAELVVAFLNLPRKN